MPELLPKAATNIFEYIQNSPSIYFLSWLNTTIKIQAFTLLWLDAADALEGKAQWCFYVQLRRSPWRIRVC